MGLDSKDLFSFMDRWSEIEVFKNPLWMALIIVCIICIIVWFILNNEVEVIYDDTSLPMLIFKAGIWGFISTLIFLFIHNKAVENDVSKKYKTVDKDRLLDKIGEGIEGSDAKITPNIS